MHHDVVKHCKQVIKFSKQQNRSSCYKFLLFPVTRPHACIVKFDLHETFIIDHIICTSPHKTHLRAMLLNVCGYIALGG